MGRNDGEAVGGSELRAIAIMVLAAITWMVLGLVGAALGSHGVLDAPLSLALGSLAIGTGFAVATARMLGRFRAALVRRQARLRALSVRLMSAQEEERRRLSRELHDGLSQSLTAVSSYLWLIEKQLPEDQETLRRQTAEARRLLAQTLGEMRELSQRLCPPLLGLYGLLPSLEAHLKAFEERHRIATSLAADLPARLPVNIETALYRITQEALTNVARHARAHRVRVMLALREGEIRLEIEDDGIGLSTTDGASRTGTGLTGIAERVRALDGTLTISSVRGTHLRICLPRVATEDLPDDTDVVPPEMNDQKDFGTFGPATRGEHAAELDA
jgi:signal transduction histidine kinase